PANSPFVRIAPPLPRINNSRISAIMAGLLDPLSIRDLTFANRAFVSPMCQYSSHDGYANDWHFVHLGSRAVGGAGLVMTEATAVLPEARISPQDLGIWSDGHIEMLGRIVSFIHEQGSIAGMQLAHAGRKASTRRPWEGSGAIPESEGGWKKVVAPSALPFAESYPMPQALTNDGIQELSPLLPQARVAHARLGSVSSRSTPRTVISFTSFCRLLVINGWTNTGSRLRTE